MMFDGAAIATAADAVAGPDPVVTAEIADRALFSHPPLQRETPVAVTPPRFTEWADPDHRYTYAALVDAVGDDGAVSGPGSREIIFIDTGVDGYADLAREWSARGEVVLIDAGRDGIDQMMAALAGRSDIDAIHIVTHGAANGFAVGTTMIDFAAVTGELAGALASIGSKLSADGDILIYGCDVSAGAQGAELIDAIAQATGADVAASIDDTGAAALGGDWHLETQAGVVTAQTLVSDRYAGLLQLTNPPAAWTIVGNVASNTIDGVTTTITFTDGTGSFTALTTDTLNNIAAFANGAQGTPDVGAVFSATGVGTITITFSEAVTNPLINLDRLGGIDGTSNSALLTLTTVGATMTKVAGPSHFVVTGTTVTRQIGVATTGGESSLTNASGTAAGTVRVNGTYTTLTFSIRMNPAATAGGGDGFEISTTIDRAPDAQADVFRINQGGTLTGNLFANNGSGADSDVRNDALTVTRINGATFTQGVPIALPTGSLTIVDASTGAFTFVPRTGFSGAQSFTYTIADGNGGTDTATVTVNVNGAPTVDLNYSPSTQNIIQNPTFADTSVWAANNWSLAGGRATFDINGATGTLTQSGLTGLDRGPSPSGAAQINVDISFNNGNPIASSPSSTLSILVGGVEYARLTGPAGGGVATWTYFRGATGNLTTVPDNAAAFSNLVLNLPSDVAASGALTFSATSGGGAADDFRVDNVQVLTTTDALAGTGYTNSFTEGGAAVSIAGTAGIIDATDTNMESATITLLNPQTGDQLRVNGSTSGTLPGGISFSVSGAVVTLTGSASKADYAAAIQAVQFSNTSDDPATVQRNISVRVNDGDLNSNTAQAVINVIPVNDAPVNVGSLPSQTSVDGASGISLTTAGGFTDVDNSSLTYSATGLPAGLTINSATGVISGTINRSASQAGAGGVYSVAVTATDAGGLSTTQNFSWVVTNPAPVATNDTTLVINEDTPGTTVNVLANDSDPDGDPLTIISASATKGTVVINANGTLTYTPNANSNGADTITYRISDGQGGTATATVAVTVNPVNDAPVRVGTAPAQAHVDGAAVSVPTALRFSDIDGDTLTYSATGLPAGLSINAATGVISGTIDRSASQGGTGGVYAVVVTARDPSGATVTQAFSWSVTNPAPTAANDTATTNEDTPVTIPVLANDTDSDGDPLTVTAAGANNGTVVRNADGTLTYTPNANFSGTDTITYTISDGQGGTSTATVTVTVAAVNDAPVPVGTLPNRSNVDAATGVSVPTAGGFSDVDNATLTYSVTGLPAGLSINAATGVISGTVNRSASQLNGGVYAVVVTARDAAGLTATQSFTWTITNPAPVAANDAVSTPEDTPVTINVLTNDSDPDGDPLAVIAAVASIGQATINPNNTITYTPPANFNGTVTINYTISDGQGGTANAQVTITVTAVQDAPVVVAPIGNRTNVDAQAGISVATAGSFSDIDGDTLTYAASGLPAGLSINASTGVISGTIDRSASQLNGGSYTVQVTATDPGGRSVSTNFTWTVTNPAPIAGNDSATTNEDTPVTIAVLANDSDPDGDPLTVTAASALNGTVTINANGTLTYAPNANFNGTDTINYTVSDGQGGTATATVTVTVNSINDGPVAGPLGNHADSDNEGVSFSIVGAFSDPDGDTLTYGATGLPAGISINPATGVISGTIDNSASQLNGGVYNVTVTANDGRGGTVSSSFVWTVTNPAPTATNDAVSTNEDVAVRIPVLANDGDPDGDALTITAATASIGDVSINPDGSLQYVPPANFNGVATISYTISDGEGGQSTAVVTVNVVPINDAPVTTGLVGQSSVDGGVISVPTSSAFSDVDGDALTFAATGLPPGLSIDPATGLISGTLPPDASDGAPYVVRIFATDPSGATVSTTFEWDVANVGPTAANDAATTPEDTPVTVNVLANDVDPDGDALTVTAANATNGSVVINPDNTLTFTPTANFSGTATINYTVRDADGTPATATVTVTVTPVNDAPVAGTPLPARTNVDGAAISVPVAGRFSDVDGDTLAYSATGLPPGLTINAVTGVISGAIDRSASQANGGVYTVVVTARDPSGATATQSFGWTVTNPGPVADSDSATTAEDTPVTINILGNDVDPDGDPLTVTAASASNGTVVINPDGTIAYTPAANFNGTDTISYTISDGQGGTSTSSVTVTVTPVNDPPVAANDTASTNEDTPVRIGIIGNDSDLDGDPLTVTSATAANGAVVVNADGTITYTPNANFNGIDTISYTISDGRGGTATATVTVTVAAVNDPPVAVADTATTAEDTPVTVNVLGNDSDVDGDPLTVTAANAANGSVTINPDGTLRYTPNANFNGTDTISYTISDGKGGFSTATVTVTVDPVNDGPIATPPLNGQISIDRAIISVTTAGNFVDPDGDVLTYSATGLPSGLTINAATGVISGTIDRSASQVNGGTYNVVVTATDTSGASAVSPFTWTVTNPVPTANNDTATTAEDTPVVVTVLANDVDPDGDPLRVTSATASNGTVVVGANGTLTYTPNANFNGTDTIVYAITDDQGGTSSASVAVTVTAVQDAPVVITPPADRAGFDAQAGISVPTAASFTDPDGDTLTYSATGLPAGLTINPTTGVISGTIDRGASQVGGGSYAVQVTATDPGGRSVTTGFTWTIGNPAPTASNDSANTAEDTPVTITVLANDTDPDGDVLTVTTATAANGTVVRNADGTLTYTPNANFNGTDIISYTISDGNGGTATATVTVTVAAVNDAPVPVGTLPQRTNADAVAVAVPVSGAFADIDNGALTYGATGLPPGLSIDATTGVISGTISNNASQANGGIYSVTITATDAGGLSATQAFTWTITNPAPTAANDTATTSEDVPVTISPLANDSDPDLDALRIASASAANGTTVINGDGTITYTPNANFNGSDTITYTITDDQGGTSTATVMVTVTAVNDGPIATPPLNGQASSDGSPTSVPTALNFRDADGDVLRYTATGLPPGLTINETTGIISGTVANNASQTNGGIYNVIVTATDPSGASADSPFTWAITNPAPSAANDVATTNEDVPIVVAVLANDNDPDNDALTVVNASAANGTVVVNGDGTITYTPRANFNGTDTINYTISDGQGGTATASVIVTVVSVNDAPTTDGVANLFDLDADVVSVPFATEFQDVDGDTLNFTQTGLPPGLSIDPDTGVVSGTIDASASTGGPGNNGVYTVTITANDGNGGSVPVTFTWTIANVGPEANDDNATMAEGATITIDVLDNDVDDDGDVLTVTDATASVGTALVNLDGSIDYTPPANFNGVATITYTITDTDGAFSTAVVTINVTPVNDAPTSGALSGQSSDDGETIAPVSVAAFFSDIDGDILQFSAADLPPGLVIDPATGVITGTINRDASQFNGGSYSVTITATDPGGLTTSQIFTWTVTNPAPTAGNDVATTVEDTPVVIPVLTNDSDPDADPLTVTNASATRGVVVINGDGTLTYTPDANFSGPDLITYTISDGNGGTSIATVALTITPGNDVPTTVGLPDRFDTNSDPVNVSIDGAFDDIDGDTLTYTATGLPAGLTLDPNTGVISGTTASNGSIGGPNGDGIYPVTVTVSDGNDSTVTTTFTWTISNIPPRAADDSYSTNEDAPIVLDVLTNDIDASPLVIVAADATNGTAVINADGTISFTPAPDFNGIATVTYTVSDGLGGFSSAVATITVVPANDAPVAAALPSQTSVDAATVDVATAASFSDIDADMLTYDAVGLPSGLAIDPVTGRITGTIAADASQINGGIYTVTVTARDPLGASASSVFTWTVGNPPPVAANDAASTTEDTAVSIAVLPNDVDPDGDVLTVVNAGAANGSVALNLDGTLTYTPNANFNGIDTITYTISDGQGGISTASVTVTVAPANDPPVAADDTAATNEDTPVTIGVLGNDSDVDGDPLVVISADADNGTVSINPDGTITYTPAGNFNGTDTITYTISDGQGGTSTAIVTVTVGAVNDPPIARPDSVTTSEDVPVTIPALANDSDAEGDPLIVTGATATNGLVVINADGTVTYTPNANFSGTDTITYTISDGNGGTATATIIVTVTPVNDPPVAANDNAVTDEDTPVTIGVLANDNDVEGDPLTVTNANAANGTVAINADGTITYTPRVNFSGTDTISYTVSDGQGGFSTATVVVTVNAVNDAPVAIDDAATTEEDTPVTIPVLDNDMDAEGDPLTVVAGSAANGTVTINPDGTITYTPNRNFNGIDTITYTISDGNGGFSTASIGVTVTIIASNDPPDTVDDSASTNEDVPVTVPVLANDSDPEGNPLTVTGANAPNGSVVVNSDGTVTYTPNANFNGTDTITYTVSDGQGGISTGTVTVTVAPVNDAPTDAPEEVTTPVDVPVTVPVLANAGDIDGDPLSIVSVTPSIGMAVINADGTVTFTPPLGFRGVATVSYVVSDGRGGTVVSSFTVSVIDTGVDMNALLGTNGLGRDDAARIDPVVASPERPFATPLIILDTVNDIRSLNGTADLNGERPLLTAVNHIDWLNGTPPLDPDGHPIADVVAHLDRLRDIRTPGEDMWDRRLDGFDIETLTGFSVRQLSGGDGQIMIESVARDNVLYVEMRDIGGADASPIVEYQLLMQGGRPLPDWIRMDARGLAIIERPLDADEIRLVVRGLRADGTIVEMPVVVQGQTGEIQIDAKHVSGQQISEAMPLGRMIASQQTAAGDETERLRAAFGEQV